MYLINRCAISRKELKESDDVVGFPFFDAEPGEPEFICCEDIALRSEFEKWHLRDNVIKKVRDFWVEQSHERSFILILAENENFLIIKSTIEKMIRLFFLNHVFCVDLTEGEWKTFKDLISAFEKGAINLEIYDLSWNVGPAKCNLILQIKDGRRDSIDIPIAEWQNLQELASAIS